MKKYFKDEFQWGLFLIIGGFLLGKINFIFNPWTVIMNVGLFALIRVIGYGMSIYGIVTLIRHFTKK